MPQSGIATTMEDDGDLIAWFLALLDKTPDVYVRAPADLASLSKATTLRDGLGIDSIGRLCAFYAIADDLGLKEDDADETIVASWSTLGDVLTFVRARRKE
jgi:acyl carrier protein